MSKSKDQRKSSIQFGVSLLLFPIIVFSLKARAQKTGPVSAETASKQVEDVAGDWQGKLGPLRAVLRIEANTAGGYCASFYSIDQSPEPIPVNEISVQSSRVQLAIDTIGATYDGAIQPDGTGIRGTWKQPDGSGVLRFTRPGAAGRWLTDASLHSASCITVAAKVQVEVLDWGGSGPPLVLLAGLGDTAHAFDTFAPKLTSRYHVYGITRRGYGASSVPDPADVSNYTADRLGDDVLAVLAALKLNRPVLAGHSIAGEELSSISSRHPERATGFVYLDAGYGYAHYDPALGDYDIDLNDLRQKLNQLSPDMSLKAEETLLGQVQADLPQFERDMQRKEKMDRVVPSDNNSAPAAAGPPPPSPGLAILLGQQKFVSLHGPILAIFAIPHKVPSEDLKDSEAAAAFQAFDTKRGNEIANSFEKDVSSSKVVRLKDADHYVFLSNEADVIREINSFIQTLPQ